MTKGVLLCGGRGTRLLPLTIYCSKHLLPVYDDSSATPIIDYPINMFKKLGILDLGIILGDFRSEDIMTYLGDGTKREMNYSYFWQGKPLGIAHAITKAKSILTEKDFFICLGDNIFLDFEALKKFVDEISKNNYDAGILLSPQVNPSEYGVARIEDNKLLEIIEKPLVPPTNYALTGFYYFNTSAFFEEFKKLRPSARGEYEISDLITNMLKKYNVYYQIYNGTWIDAGTFENIKRLEQL